MRIIHSDGVWLVNKCRLPMADPTQDVRLEPGELTCVKFSGWLKMQTAAGLFEQASSPTTAAVPGVRPIPQKVKSP